MGDVAWPLAVVASVGLFSWRMERTALAIAEKWVTLHQPEIDAHVATQTLAAPRDPMPFDVEAHAALESEPWAREQTIAAIKDLYEEHRDWNKVLGMVTQ